MGWGVGWTLVGKVLWEMRVWCWKLGVGGLGQCWKDEGG
jgi:hypothetical protein